MNENNADELCDSEPAFVLRESRENMIAAATQEDDLVGNSFKIIELKSFCTRRNVAISSNSTKADIITAIISDNILRKSRDQGELLSEC